MKDKVLFLIHQKQHYIYITFCLLILVTFITKLSNKRQNNRPVINNSVDTFIPKGFVLVPIDIVNPEALNDIIGDYGYVDLYTNQSKNNLVSYKILIKNIKLLKSPVDPNIIAVLSPDNMVSSIVKVNGKFKIAIKSKSVKKTEFAAHQDNKKRIIFE